ncbi:hypothetical protein [Thermodesulfobium narugense]|uniref:hypothetical protein n=1 Tax=Thermodesulfobium narugense TaxID=184064 RepID=UPI0002D94434|nr:hypothetical protein [Thermodesulfobium narugense]
MPQIKNLNENNKPLRIVVTITLEARNGVNDEGRKAVVSEIAKRYKKASKKQKGHNFR